MFEGSHYETCPGLPWITNLLNLSDVPWGGPWSTRFAPITAFICGVPFQFWQFWQFWQLWQFSLPLYCLYIPVGGPPSLFFELLWLSYGYSCRPDRPQYCSLNRFFTNYDASCNGVAPSSEETSAVDELAGGGSSDDPVTRCTDDPISEADELLQYIQQQHGPSFEC